MAKVGAVKKTKEVTSTDLYKMHIFTLIPLSNQAICKTALKYTLAKARAKELFLYSLCRSINGTRDAAIDSKYIRPVRVIIAPSPE